MESCHQSGRSNPYIGSIVANADRYMFHLLSLLCRSVILIPQLLVLAVRSLSRTAYSTFKQQTDSFTVQVSRNKLFQKT